MSPTDYMRNERMACYDCGHDCAALGERYMVHDYIWHDLVTRGEQYTGGAQLCIGCLEARLGRRLDRHDFKRITMNDCPGDGYATSLRIRSRLRLVAL